MSGVVPRVLFALCACWCVLDELELGPLHGVVPAALVGNTGYSAVTIVAALLILWRAARSEGRERLAWGLIGTGALLWSLGDVYWDLVLSTRDHVPVPSPSDLGYLAMYPLVAAGFLVLLRGQVRATSRALWIDGFAAAVAVGSVSAALVMQTVWDTLPGDTTRVLTNLAYPVGDLLLLGVAIGAWALRGWRVDRTWALLAAAIVAFWVADSYYLVALADGTYVDGSAFDDGWALCMLLLAVAAWQRRAPGAVRVEAIGMRFIAWPGTFAALALVLLVLSAALGLNPFALGLAALSLAASLVRLVVSLRENARMLETSRREALTDSLTGLGNRRALMRDLALRLEEGTPSVLALFDLDGFKAYNDSFGHPAGDALLARLGAKLADHAAATGTAYRMGGDEFCVLVDLGDDGQDVAAAEALAEQGDGFDVRASFGAVQLPAEVDEAGEALRLVDQRMYARKHRGRTSARRQSSDVLLRALAERDPVLSEHLTGVASLAESVAARLGLSEEGIEQVLHAAALHDVGKMAIPDAILQKPGPLDDAEWAFIRRHTLIGERIVGAAPSLLPVAKLVRSSHERFDGGGYPDGLAAGDIPLGARIVSVCDSFDAMVADRPYRASMRADEAIAELRRCAGTQFDPAVVDAFAAAWAERVTSVVAA